MDSLFLFGLIPDYVLEKIKNYNMLKIRYIIFYNKLGKKNYIVGL